MSGCEGGSPHDGPAISVVWTLAYPFPDHGRIIIERIRRGDPLDEVGG